MRLLSCRLRQVRLHRDLQLQFGRRLSLIGGPNEAGKSTLVEALHKGLFLRCTATGRGVEELRSRIHPGLPEVEIGFEADGQTWQLRKRFSGSSGTCQLSNGAGVALSGAAAEEQLARLLGVEGPVEGRRLAQLPERWAHLWVRQGEAPVNPLQGPQERYDYGRLVDQLQARGGGGALVSALDRQVLEQLQQQVAQLFTATGRVKAGSPLAEAQQRLQQAAAQREAAQQRFEELEAAMEELRAIGERLQAIEQQERPALLQRQAAAQQLEQRRQALEHRRQLLQAECDPLVRQLQQAEQQQQERQQLLAQQQQQLLAQQRQAAELVALEQQQQHLQTALTQQRQQRQALEQQRQQGLEQQQLGQRRLELLQLEQEEQQLHQHQRELAQLQGEADTIKGQLAALPAISAEQVKQLRQLEQALAQAEARCQAMAASLELLQADQAVQLDGQPLAVGEPQWLTGPAELAVGGGVVLRLSPGGGQALPQAEAERQRCRQALALLQQQLQLPSSEAAEAIERQRRALEQELASLRKAASAIPWAGLSERIAALAPRRQQLQSALAPHPELAAMPRPALELRQQQLEHQLQEGAQALSALAALQQQQEAQERELNQQLQQSRGQVDQRAGSLQALAERLAAAEQLQGSAETLEQQRQQLQGQLHQRQQQLEALERERAALDAEAAAAGTAALAAGLQQLEQEQNSLLTRRGQAEQRCASLGASDPVAELEQCQAQWEAAAAEHRALERQGQALLLLQQRFHEAQTELANRYSEPLRQAIAPYLNALASAGGQESWQPLLAFDPQQGFHDLQLRQGEEAYGFERLSGGMREQLAAALRLALAEVLQPAYDHCLPLVFDDAFTNSDRQRLLGLQQMLKHGMAQGLQILLLTCQPEDYSALVEALEQERPESARQANTPTGTADGGGGAEVVRLQLERAPR